VRETNLCGSDLIQPIFIIEGKNKKQRIPSMPNMNRLSIDMAIKEVRSLTKNGIGAVALFPQIEQKKKSIRATEAHNDDGLIQRAIREIKNKVPDSIIISDVALDPYTTHGQDGILSKGGKILNDETVEVLVKQALSHAKSGADIIAPSDMMDGRVLKIRDALEKNKFIDTMILSYSAKYSSNFYGPFRDAVGSAKNLGTSNKDSYQMDYANINDAIREVQLDMDEGADFFMVKPGLPYLDIVQRIKEKLNVPIFVYQVSGEYSMMKAASQKGWLNEEKIVMETLACIKRAGATAIITYYAKEALKWMK
tara:strand:+ start:44 stop:970 length:927 start_codon:yes stop_codon:yes gene_type:complete